MKKQIGIFGAKTGANSFGITVPYYDFFNYFGDVSIISPVEGVDYKKYDLVVFPGGPDLLPSARGIIPSMQSGKADPIREYIDAYLLPRVIESGVSIVGICRGHQAIAAHFGSYITQHMYHGYSKETNRGEEVHNIDIFPNALPEALRSKIYASTLKHKQKQSNNIRIQGVNSLHHQVVDDVPEGATLLAQYSDKAFPSDKSIEALYYPNHNIVTFQYHPEELWDTLSMIIIEHLIEEKHASTGANTKEKAEIVG